MKVLLVHNSYQWRGGEDVVFEAEAELLEQHGHPVVRYTAHNDEVNAFTQVRLAQRAVWNGASYAAVRRLIQRDRPAVMHVHNTLPLISPSVYYAAQAEGVPVVQTLHNYRLLCPNGLLFRQGSVCEDCVGRSVPWPAVAHRCYRDSGPASATVATVLTLHRLGRTWTRQVSAYVALTDFARRKFVDGGLPANRIVVKPNFVSPDPGVGEGRGGYALFVGRLSREKGIGTLLAAWRAIRHTVPLTVAGDGPLASEVATAADQIPGMTYVGAQSTGQVQHLLANAMCLVFPSEWYETFGRVIAEAYACGTPVVASHIGAGAELVRDGICGVHFRAGDPDDLANTITAIARDAHALARMRRSARAEFEQKYTADRNYQMLTDIYRRVLRRGTAGAHSDELSPQPVSP